MTRAGLDTLVKIPAARAAASRPVGPGAVHQGEAASRSRAGASLRKRGHLSCFRFILIRAFHAPEARPGRVHGAEDGSPAAPPRGFVRNETTSRNTGVRPGRCVTALTLRPRWRNEERTASRPRPRTNKYEVTANYTTPNVPSAECVTAPVPITALASLHPTFKGGCTKMPSHRVTPSTPEEPRFLGPAAHRQAPTVCLPWDRVPASPV